MQSNNYYKDKTFINGEQELRCDFCKKSEDSNGTLVHNFGCKGEILITQQTSPPRLVTTEEGGRVVTKHYKLPTTKHSSECTIAPNAKFQRV